MGLDLTRQDLDRLAGQAGPAVEFALSIVVRMAEIYGASRLLDITAAHIDSTIYVGPATLEFAERVADMGGRVAVPSTANVSGVDEQHWQEWPVPPDWAHNAIRQMEAYRRMGVEETWTCAPYQAGNRPTPGQQVAWGESNAIAFVNSVLGARTERYPDLLDICCAISGRAPAAGLHLVENRAGEILFRLEGVPRTVQAHESFFPVLGHLLGKAAQEQIGVVSGLNVRPSEDDLKALCAAAASSGPVGLVHLVGVTPEAPTVESALHGRRPRLTIDITTDDLRVAHADFSTATSDDLDAVIIGCPHLSLDEFSRLAVLVSGRHAASGVRFVVTAGRVTAELARAAGHLDALKAFGGQLTLDTCPLASPMLPADVRRVMTSSGKHAYYAPGLLKVAVTFGTLADCVESAVAGRIVREEPQWKA